MSRWAQSKQEPGQFTGSTGAQILTPKELASGYQAWARRVSTLFLFRSILFLYTRFLSYFYNIGIFHNFGLNVC